MEAFKSMHSSTGNNAREGERVMGKRKMKAIKKKSQTN